MKYHGAITTSADDALYEPASAEVIDEPSQPEMLFLHGIPTNAALWQPLVERLDGVRAVAPDLPGYGNAPHPRNPSISAYHRFISAVLDSGGCVLPYWSATISAACTPLPMPLLTRVAYARSCS